MTVTATPLSTVEVPPAGGLGDPQPRGRSSYLAVLRTPRGAVGAGLVLIVVLVALIGPLFAGSATAQGQDALAGSSGAHLLGTDEVGRDLFARLLVGTRVDLFVTLIAVPISGILGTLLGLVGIVSRVAGAFFQRIFDVLLGIPAIILGIGVALAMKPGELSVIVAIVLATLPKFGKQASSALLVQMPQEYVAAAQVLGYSKMRILFRHILPNITDAMYVRFAVEMAHAVVIEGGLSLVGLGIQPPQPSLGSMVKSGSTYLFTLPTYSLAPVLVVVALLAGYMLLADALNGAKLRR
jgi:peptide/nickel transport system permease protein